MSINKETEEKYSLTGKSKSSLQKSLTLWFITVALIPLVIVSWLSYQQTRSSLIQSATEKLHESATISKLFIDSWFSYRFMDVNNQAEMKTNSQLLSSLIQGLEASQKPLNQYIKTFDWYERIDNQQTDLQTLNRHYDYIYDSFLIDTQGNILYTVAHESDLGTNLITGPFRETLFSKTVQATLASGKTLFSGVERYTPSFDVLSGFMSAPLTNDEGEVIGVFALQLRLDRIYEVMSNKEGTSLTHYLVSEDTILQTPIRNNWQEVLHRRIETEQVDLWRREHTGESVLPDDMEEKAFEYIGPDGVTVFGVHQLIKIGNVKWLLISEINSDEALADANWLARLTFWLLIITAVITSVFAIFQAKRITQPIIQLAQASRKIASGQTSDKVNIASDNEIGQLIAAFNNMVSSRQKYESALRRTSEETQDALDKLKEQQYALDQHAIVAITDIKGTITYANQRFADISGYARDELIGENHRILKTNVQDSAFWLDFYKTIKSGKVWHGEICNRTKSGSLYWVETTVIPFMGKNQKPQSYIAIRTDITKRKKAELALAKSEASARAIFNSVADGIIALDINGEIQSINPAAEVMFGYQTQQLVNQHISLLIPSADDSEEFETSNIISMLQNGDQAVNKQSTESYGLNSSGSFFPIELSISEIEIEKEHLFTLMVRNITLRKEVEAQHQAQYQVTQVKLAIAKALSLPISLKHKYEKAIDALLEFDFLYCHKKAAVFLIGSDQASLNLFAYRGKFNQDLGKDKQAAWLAINKREVTITSAGEPNDSSGMAKHGYCVIPLARHEAEIADVFGSLLLYTEESPNSSGEHLVMLQEIGDMFSAAMIQENARKLLKEASKTAEQSNKLKSEFLASMSHEIRTPMNGVLGMLGLLQQTELNQDQQHKAELAKSSAESLLSLINDILDFSKVEAGKMELDIIDFNLRGMLGEFAEAMAHRAQSKNLELILDVTKIEQSLVQGDPNRLRQILTNLVGNAIKFTDQGEVIIRAHITEQSNDKLQFHCSVRDTGIGIPKNKLPTLFEAFSQVDASTTREYGGTGLGLSICKQLCQLMNGDISVSSTQNIGSCFSFNIELQTSHKSQLVLPKIDVSSLHLLIIDDNTTNREVLRGQLEHWGADVTEACNGRQALALCYQRLNHPDGLFDVAFLDMSMPEMDGAELGIKIRENQAFDNMKLVMMTSLSTGNEAQYFADLGFNGFFPKPATTSDIFNALSVVVDNGEALQQATPLVTHDYIQTLLPNDQTPEDVKACSLKESLAQKRLLLVEDNKINQLVALGLLEKYHLTADLASNGLEAIEILAAEDNSSPYHLVLMDCQMPEMDGYQATREIRKGKAGQNNKGIVIIAMTANAMEGDKEKCIDAGMNDYLSKPIEEGLLYEKLCQWLVPGKDKAHKTELKAAKRHKREKSTKAKDMVSLSHEPPPESAPQTWDKQAILKRVGGNTKLLAMLIDNYQEQIPPLLEELQQAIDQYNLEVIRQHAHTIRGVAGNISALTLQQAAKALETKVKSKNTSGLDSLYADLLQAHQDFIGQALQDVEQ